jgi:hypothetical protein
MTSIHVIVGELGEGVVEPGFVLVRDPEKGFGFEAARALAKDLSPFGIEWTNVRFSSHSLRSCASPAAWSELEFEGNWNIPKAGSATTSFDGRKDYRYRFWGRLDETYGYVTVNVKVWWTGQSAFILTSAYAEVCRESGCADLDIPRDPYACQPSPTRSHSPSKTISQSPTRTVSQSPTPTARRGVVLKMPGSKRDANIFK